MIRQYRAFEDMEEPCFLVPEPEWITVTYQMKSIICQWRWDEIRELITKNLSKPIKKKKQDMIDSVNNGHHHGGGGDSESLKDLRHSQIQIRPPPSNSVPASPDLRINNSKHHHHQLQQYIPSTPHHHHKDPDKILKKNLLKIEFLKKPNDDTQQPLQTTTTTQPLKPKWYRFDSREILDEFLSDANSHGYIERLVYKKWFMTKVKYVPLCHRQINNDNQKNHHNSSTELSSSSLSSLTNDKKQKKNDKQPPSSSTKNFTKNNKQSKNGHKNSIKMDV